MVNRNIVKVLYAANFAHLVKSLFLGEDFSMKEMRKVYDIPENASFEHMTSFLTAKGWYFLSIIQAQMNILI